MRLSVCLAHAMVQFWGYHVQFKTQFRGTQTVLNNCYRDKRRHSNYYDWTNVKCFCASIGVFSACLPAILQMMYAIENRSSREFQVMSGFKRKNSEAEQAFQRTNAITLVA